jgi:hypothetical protein
LPKTVVSARFRPYQTFKLRRHNSYKTLYLRAIYEILAFRKAIGTMIAPMALPKRAMKLNKKEFINQK